MYARRTSYVRVKCLRCTHDHQAHQPGTDGRAPSQAREALREAQHGPQQRDPLLHYIYGRSQGHQVGVPFPLRATACYTVARNGKGCYSNSRENTSKSSDSGKPSAGNEQHPLPP